MGRLVISLTSIPPRFAELGPVLDGLATQAADRVELWIPQSYERFPDWDGHLPGVPAPVAVRRTARDLGPATKLLPARAAHPDADILICDDDVVYGPDWAAGFLSTAGRHPGSAVAASGFEVRRLGMPDAGPDEMIVQGFAGVLLPPGPVTGGTIDRRDRYVDDIWLSAQLAASGTPVIVDPGLRRHSHPLDRPAALQDAEPDGFDRARANHRSASALAAELGIWSGDCRSG